VTGNSIGPRGSAPRRPTVRVVASLSMALLLATLACLLVRPATSSAGAFAARCAARSASSGSAARACARRGRRTHVGHKHHRVRRALQPGVTGMAPAAPALATAACEDGSTPTLESEGFACADGSEPTCADGAEPIPATNGSRAVCPALPAGSVEWNEAGCEDGSTPTLVSGAYACEDGSQPICEAGSQPVSGAGPTLSCVVYAPGSAENPSPAGDEGSEDAAKALAASAS
jgi:hypothetical protein